MGVQMDPDGARRLNRSSPSCLNSGAQRTDFFHGLLRSSFRDWASEQTDADHAVMELSLAHQVGSAVERAYSRSNLLAKRRELMDRWAKYATAPYVAT